MVFTGSMYLRDDGMASMVYLSVKMKNEPFSEGTFLVSFYTQS
jgi:hypothetical protein